jgi:glucan endo-1,3-alpha-glucosidase
LKIYVFDSYTAAEQSGLGFKLFLSLDMSYVIMLPKPTDRPLIYPFPFSSLPCASPDDATNLRNLVSTYISHPNQLQYASRAFVSTFAGESCTFGQATVPDGWSSQFSNHADLSGKIFFVPAFFIDPSSFAEFADVMDGEFNVRLLHSVDQILFDIELSISGIRVGLLK